MIDTESLGQPCAIPRINQEGAHELTIHSMVGRLAACHKVDSRHLSCGHSLLTLPLETGTFEVDELALQESLSDERRHQPHVWHIPPHTVLFT